MVGRRGRRTRGGSKTPPPGAESRPVAGLPNLDALVDATPATRDRVVDFLRAASICVVVLWHWSLSITHWNADYALVMPNPIGYVPGKWALTWVLQVMPVFFFVGGYANLAGCEAVTRDGRRCSQVPRVAYATTADTASAFPRRMDDLRSGGAGHRSAERARLGDRGFRSPVVHRRVRRGRGRGAHHGPPS
jgi:hypothetical protein